MSVTISRILHAGYVFACDGVEIAFDTIFENPFSRNCHAFPDVKFDQERIKELHFSAVFISHYHDDHCSFESLDLLDRRTPLYLFCVFDELFTWLRELGFEDVHRLALDEPVRVGPFEVIPRRALDAEVDSIFQIKADGLNLLNVVDSWIDAETIDLLVREKPWDLVLWPFQTMCELEVLAPSRFEPASRELPPEWLGQLRALEPSHVVPSSCQFRMESWSWYNRSFFPITYRQFQSEVEKAVRGARVVRMNPGVSLTLDRGRMGRAPSLSWVLPVGEQDVDYEYDGALSAPPIAEIANRFAPLTAEQRDRVFMYCHEELPAKSASLPPPEDPYFQEQRIWQLSLYDHSGCVTVLRYRLSGGRVELVGGDAGPVGWLTEVAIAKVYAALELGESLTSMYMRINAMTFAPEIEREILAADILEDPLIRGLFQGVFGAYQFAQLKSLKRRHAALGAPGACTSVD